MDALIVLVSFGIWVAMFALVGSTYSATRRIERKIDSVVKHLEQQELYERMKNQQPQQYQQYGNMNGYDQNNRL